MTVSHRIYHALLEFFHIFAEIFRTIFGYPYFIGSVAVGIVAALGLYAGFTPFMPIIGYVLFGLIICLLTYVLSVNKFIAAMEALLFSITYALAICMFYLSLTSSILVTTWFVIWMIALTLVFCIIHYLAYYRRNLEHPEFHEHEPNRH
jgi:lysylphosphatidylglycerol synthetase-like protein (DUF2156 family)